MKNGKFYTIMGILLCIVLGVTYVMTDDDSPQDNQTQPTDNGLHIN